MKIVVLAGGLSPERDVSLTSGSLIANALTRKGHKVCLLDVYEGIELSAENGGAIFEKNKADGSGSIKNPDSLFSGDRTYSHKIEENAPSLGEVKKANGGREALIGKNVLEVCAAADIVFIALHGAMGENGQLQATFDNYNIKYTGSGYVGSLLAMDKDLTKQLIARAGIPTADWITVNTRKNEDISEADVTEIEEKIGYPCVVKPCSCGSSVGVSIVYSREELYEAFGFAKEYEGLIIAEKLIRGREISVGVLNGIALPPVEIIPKHGFYDYKNKYQSGMTEEICPAPLNGNENAEVSRLSVLVHETMRLGVYSRVDFIIDENGVPICLEVNSLPGMTPISLLPQMAAAAGIDYDTLCDSIVQMSMKKFD